MTRAILTLALILLLHDAATGVRRLRKRSA